MAKANVLARRFRAYDRAIEALTQWVRNGPADLVAEQRKACARYDALRVEAVGALDLFLANRKAGPWMGYANADEAAYA